MEKALRHVASWALVRMRIPPVFCLLLALAGCKSVFDGETPSERLRVHVDHAIAREIADFAAEAEIRTTPTGPPSDVEEALAARREELDALSPVPSGSTRVPELGTDLTGETQRLLAITLKDAIVTAVDENLGVRLAQLQPAISEEEIIAAEAVFDAVLFGSSNFVITDEPAAVPVLGGVQLGTPFSKSRQYIFETGIRKQFSSTGGTLQVSTDLTRFHNLSPGISFIPNPGYTTAVRLGLTQPLLREFGAPSSKAVIRLSRNQQRRSIEELRRELLTVVSDTESAYWDLALAWKTLAISEWLVEVGVEVREVLRQRFEVFDVRLSEYSDAVAVVEQRKADVIRARRTVRAASDRLKTLLDADAIPVGSEVLLSPVNEALESPVEYNLADAIHTALMRRPDIEQALLNIDDAEVRQALADHLRLPRLDLTGEIAYVGIARSPDDAYDQSFEGSFVSYVLGLVFEYPLGNRAADAEFRARRLERTGTILAFQRAVRDVIFDLKSALRDVLTNYELIQATRSFRVAQAENLRTLQAQKELMAALTPEFLNLEFQRQATLAEAQRQEFEALTNYNKSVAELYRAMGTGLDMNGIDVEIVNDPPGDDR
jgi:outer membrane protein